MTSKWFKQYCELNRHDQDMILDKIKSLCKSKKCGDYWAYIYTSIVYEHTLTMEEVENIIDRFNSSSDREAKRLREKLERLRSQS